MLPALVRLSFRPFSSSSRGFDSSSAPVLLLPLPSPDGRPIRVWPNTEDGLEVLSVTFEGVIGNALPVDDKTELGRSARKVGGCNNVVGVDGVEPNEDLFIVGPVDLFPWGRLLKDPEVGIGRNVGVAGREVGVAMELVVETVLILSRPLQLS